MGQSGAIDGSMEKYVSKIPRSSRPAWQLYERLATLKNLGQLAGNEHVSDVHATDDECRFTVEGKFSVGLRIVDRTPNSTIKLAGTEDSPLNFTAWIQLKEVGEYDTAIRITVHAAVPLLLRMMAKKRIQRGLDEFAERLASV